MNMLDSYNTYFRGLWPILAAMSRRGIPIDPTARQSLKELIDREDLRVTAAIQEIVPPEILSTKQANGYKNPPILTCEDCGWKGREDHLCQPIEEESSTSQPPDSCTNSEAPSPSLVPYSQLAESNGLCLREIVLGEGEKCRCGKKERESGSCAVCAGSGIIPAGTREMRWATPTAFNPNSSLQVKRFMRFMKHPVPKHAKRVDAQGEASDTTEVKELQRLFAKTKHPIYPMLIEKRQLTKMDGTYVTGYAPGKDGKIHTTYTFQTATWQTSSRSPNVQNSPARGKTPFQKALVDGFGKMLCASEGHTLVNLDYKSFHAQTTGCEAGLKEYVRLAKIDIHSFNTCHAVRHPERHNLLGRSDADLKAFFKELRKSDKVWTNGMTFSEIRDSKMKSCGLGIGFGMGPRKLYQLYQEDFASQREAEAMWSLIMVELFPGLLKWQTRVKAKAAEDKRLVSRFGAIRHFYDVQHFDRKQQKFVGGDQAEAAVAFLPASNAFGMIRWGMLNLEAEGMLEKYRLINSTHDSLKFDCPNPLVEECKERVREVMQRPCPMMVYPGVTGLEGLSVEVDSQVGANNYEMH